MNPALMAMLGGSDDEDDGVYAPRLQVQLSHVDGLAAMTILAYDNDRPRATPTGGAAEMNPALMAMLGDSDEEADV